MSNNYLTANITLKGMSDKGLTIQVIDSNNLKWIIWKNAYQSAEQSEAYLSLQNFKMGDSFGVSYQEKDKQFTNDKGKLITFKERIIYSILPVIAKPTATPQLSTISQPRASGEVTSNSKPQNGKSWDDIAVGKCQFGFLVAYIEAGHSFEETKLQVIPALHLAELTVYGTQRTTEDLPVIQQDEPPIEAYNDESNLEDIS